MAELYRNANNVILRVERLTNGRLMCKSKNENTSFENYKQLAAHLYNKGYHILTTDRAVVFTHNYRGSDYFIGLTDLIPKNELAFQKDGIIYTCWFLAFKRDKMAEVKCNCDFAYTNALGYKAVTVNICDLILITGDI